MKSHVKEALDQYVEHGYPPGGFLEAVLANDLRGAICHADEGNLADLVEIVRYIGSELPQGCFGTFVKVKGWMKEGGVEGLQVIQVARR